MEKQDFDYLFGCIKNIILNKALEDTIPSDCSPEVKELQEGLLYLSICMQEFNQLSQDVCNGKLDIALPNRQNLLVGNLKELHSILKHLTWQTQQVANGDYSQEVSFLGDFSDSFNLMISQLKERELQLKEKSMALTKSTELLISIMEAHRDWIIVTDLSATDILYSNKTYDGLTMTSMSQNKYNHEKQHILEHIQKSLQKGGLTQSLFFCEADSRFYNIRSYLIEWKSSSAYAHYISDGTEEELEKQELTEFAYIDELTKTYNRRFCMNTLDDFLRDHFAFSLVLIDINNLKFVNDTFGHLAGDEYICTVVDAIKSTLREIDIVCRIGGDEFVVLLKDCQLHDAEHRMNDIQRKLNAISHFHPLSISYGIEYVDGIEALHIDNLLHDADRKMYLYKQDYKKTHLA